MPREESLYMFSMDSVILICRQNQQIRKAVTRSSIVPSCIGKLCGQVQSRCGTSRKWWRRLSGPPIQVVVLHPFPGQLHADSFSRLVEVDVLWYSLLWEHECSCHSSLCSLQEKSCAASSYLLLCWAGEHFLSLELFLLLFFHLSFCSGLG
jgi:hypothetical protein